MVALEELVLETQYGTAAKSNEAGLGQPVLRMNNITYDGTFDLTDVKWVELPSGEAKKLHVRRGDLLFNRTNSRELVGKMAVWEGSDEFTFAGYLVRVRLREDRVLPRWVSRFMNSPVGKTALFHMAKPSINMANISASDLLRLHVPVAPIDHQRRTIALLDKADAIRRKREEAIALTEELLRSAFLEMVGPEAKGYANWPEARFENFAAPGPSTMRTGPFGSDLRHSEFVEEGVAVLGIDNAVRNRFAWDERRYITHEKYDRLRRYTVRPNDVIVTIMGTTGRSAVVPNDIPLAITTKHLATITVNRGLVEPEFVAQAIHRHPAVLAQIQQANRGAIMSGLNLGLIKSLVVRRPPIEVQRQFAAFTDRVRVTAMQLEAAGDTSHLLFNALADRAFRAELTSSASRSPQASNVSAEAGV